MAKDFSSVKPMFFVLLGVIACLLLAWLGLQDEREVPKPSNTPRADAYALDKTTLEDTYKDGLKEIGLQRYREAEPLIRKAALAGHSGAQLKLATLYENGFGLPKDGGQACYWYRVAAQNENAEAQKALDRPSPKSKKDEGATWEAENC